jgi:hypothetical protein
MAKVKKRKIRWEPSNSSNVLGYKLYWNEGSGVNYDSECALVGNITELVLPDAIPSFPVVKGPLELGITAVTEVGNESDMIKITAPFQFAVPEPPADPVLDAVQDFHIYHEEGDKPIGVDLEDLPDVGEASIGSEKK